MRKLILGAIAVLSVGGTLALADTITFGTPSGSTAGGESVSAQAVVITGSGTVSVALSNNIANIHDAGQLLSDFSFTLSGSNFGTVTGGSGSATLITLDSNGNVTSTTPNGDAEWDLTLDTVSGGLMVTLEGLGGGQPHGLVIGPPCSDGTYCNANSSIAGNGPHNGFSENPLNFSLNIAGVTASTTISDSVFSFSTTAGVTVDGVPTTPTTPVPEPVDFGLAGLGLIALGCARKRIFRRNS